MAPIGNPLHSRDWTRERMLGKGRFAEVFLAKIRPENKMFAIKSVERTDEIKKRAIQNEKKSLEACDSKYVVQFLGCCVTTVKDKEMLYLFMEYVPRGSILDKVKRNGGNLPEKLIAVYTRDILHGLEYIHGKKLVHGDIKCENLLVGKHNIKLCDFGASQFLKPFDVLVANARRPGYRVEKMFSSTPEWLAPGIENEGEQSKASDIYALGCTIVEMCTGKPPQKFPVLYTFVKADRSKPDNNDIPRTTVDVPPNYSKACRQFVDHCLRRDPEGRPSAAELLEYSWIENASLEGLSEREDPKEHTRSKPVRDSRESPTRPPKSRAVKGVKGGPFTASTAPQDLLRVDGKGIGSTANARETSSPSRVPQTESSEPPSRSREGGSSGARSRNNRPILARLPSLGRLGCAPRDKDVEDSAGPRPS